MTPVEALVVVTMYGVGCGVKPNHPTRAGTLPVVEFTVAADPRVFPIGTILEIEGFVGSRQVHDIGPKVKRMHLDLFVADCADASNWGRKQRRVRVLHVPGAASLRSSR